MKLERLLLEKVEELTLYVLELEEKINTLNELNRMKPLIILVLILPLLFLGCKKYEQPELTPLNEDCGCASEVSADFEILELESLPQFDPIGTDSDTIFHESNVIFRAKEDNAEYTWYIGSEILNTQEVGRNFPISFGGQDITVSLVVRKATNSICLPNDDGYDSISRTFHVQPYGICDLTSQYINDTTLMKGVFRMKSAHLPDSFDITIDYIDYVGGAYNYIEIYNYDGLGSNVINIPRCSATLKTYRGLWIEGQGTFYNCFSGTLFYSINGVANFKIKKCDLIGGNYVTTEYTYTGRKL